MTQSPNRRIANKSSIVNPQSLMDADIELIHRHRPHPAAPAGGLRRGLASVGRVHLLYAEAAEADLVEAAAEQRARDVRWNDHLAGRRAGQPRDERSDLT